MKVFSKCEPKLKPIVDLYKRGREIPRISITTEYNGKKYRELIYNAASIFGKPKSLINGVVYLDEEDKVVTDKKIQKELSTVFFYIEQLFEDTFLKNLSKAIISEANLKLEAAQAEFLEANLMLLNTRNVNGAETVKEIVSVLPELKRANNIAIENFIQKTNEYKKLEIIKSDVIINEIKPLYTQTLMKNFEKIKLIGTGRNHYGAIKKESLKLFRKKMLGTMGSKVEGSASKLDYELNHLMHVVNVYEQIIDMSIAQYIKYLNDMDKEHIKDKIDSNRA